MTLVPLMAILYIEDVFISSFWTTPIGGASSNSSSVLRLRPHAAGGGISWNGSVMLAARYWYWPADCSPAESGLVSATHCGSSGNKLLATRYVRHWFLLPEHSGDADHIILCADGTGAGYSVPLAFPDIDCHTRWSGDQSSLWCKIRHGLRSIPVAEIGTRPLPFYRVGLGLITRESHRDI